MESYLAFHLQQVMTMTPLLVDIFHMMLHIYIYLIFVFIIYIYNMLYILVYVYIYTIYTTDVILIMNSSKLPYFNLDCCVD